ncbi:MAG: DUF364 domain-containing protein [Atribacterota bacterium]
MLINNVLAEAKPYLIKSKIKDAVLGISLIGIELDNKDIGLAYMLREHLPAGCSVFGFGQELIGTNAYKVAQLAQNGSDDAQRGVGIAVLTAGSRQLALPDEDKNEPFFGLEINSYDVVGMIGYIPPVAKRFAEKVKDLIVFDEDISRCGGESIECIKPMAKQEELLPNCDVVIITGTTFINHTIDKLLDVCSNAREIVLVGASTPMYPKAFLGTNVSVLAGSWWNNRFKADLFKKISLSGGIHHIQNYMIKKAVMVKRREAITKPV